MVMGPNPSQVELGVCGIPVYVVLEPNILMAIYAVGFSVFLLGQRSVIIIDQCQSSLSPTS